jgi:DNA-binding LytR/AlgR family response regulator
MKSIIIDDEKVARTIISQLISKNENLSLVSEFSNATEAIKFLNQQSIDLIFLDIHMPNFTGFDLIQTLKNPPKVILITSDKNFALDAFEYECIVDYIVKPIFQERFNKSIQKAITASSSNGRNDKTELKDSEKELYVNIDRRLIKINFESIKLVEAKGDYILIKTTTKNYTVHSTLKKIEEKLPADLFLKIHRSYIINTKKIIDIEDNSVLIDRDVIPVSRSNKPELIRRLNLL